MSYPQGSLSVEWATGNHGVIGRGDYTGDDKVYIINSNSSFTMSLC